MPKNESSFSSDESEADRPKGRRSADKREKILRAAIKVFAQNGFYATRVSEIAKAAGVADGTIYLYFKNKDDVLISIFEDRISKLLEVLRAEVAKEQSFEGKFQRVIELQLGLLEGQRDLAEVVTVNLRQSSRLLKQYAAPLFREYLEIIGEIVEEGQQAGRIREELSPRVVARGLWGALDGIALTWALSPPATVKPESLRRAATQIASVFLYGLRKSATPLGADDA